MGGDGSAAGHRSRVDWQAVKTEYITTRTSYRRLAQKHGLSYNTVADKGKEEGWVELKEKLQEKTQLKIVDGIGKKQVDRAARLQSVADKLLEKVDGLLGDDTADQMDSRTIKNLSGVLKDIKEIQMIRSKADLEEQQERIANLRKRAEKEEKDNEPIRIIFDGDIDKYSK